MMDPAEADMIVSMFSNALADAVDGAAILREWGGNYPELASDFAALVVEHASGEYDDLFDAETTAQEVLMQRLFSEMTPEFGGQAQGQSADSLVGVSDLRTASTARGIAYPAELARRLRLPSTLLEKIALRRLDVGSIPLVLIQQMSSILEVGRNDVSAWLTSTVGAASASPAYVREGAAPYGVPATFAAAIENALDVDEADRDYWRKILGVSRTMDDVD